MSAYRHIIYLANKFSFGYYETRSQGWEPTVETIANTAGVELEEISAKVSEEDGMRHIRFIQGFEKNNLSCEEAVGGSKLVQ